MHRPARAPWSSGAIAAAGAIVGELAARFDLSAVPRSRRYSASRSRARHDQGSLFVADSLPPYRRFARSSVYPHRTSGLSRFTALLTELGID